MREPVSLFIMDVGRSKKFTNPRKLTEYLGKVCDDISLWTDAIVPTKAKHRFGDEIILVSRGFATSYIIASYIYSYWLYPGHKPYFGLTHGYIDIAVDDLPDLDIWNDPIIAFAREANDELKRQGITRKWLTFNNDGEMPQRIDTLNLLVEIKDNLLRNQTHQQHVAHLLSEIEIKQSDISKIMEKPRSAISRLISRGQSDVLRKIDQQVEVELAMLQDQCTKKDFRTIAELRKNIYMAKMRDLFFDKQIDYFLEIFDS